MSRFQTNLKVFIRTPFLFLITLLGILGYFGFQLQDLLRYHNWSNPDDYDLISPLRQMLRCSIYLFVFFLFISYEYFAKLKQEHMDEVVEAAPRGLLRTQGAQFAVISILLGTVTLLMFAFLAIVAALDHVADGPFLWHLCKNVLLCVGLPGLLSVLAGWTFSFTKNRLAGYSGLILIALLVSPVPELLGEGLATSVNVNLFPLIRLIQIMPSGVSWFPNMAAGFSVLPYQFAGVLFWIALFSLLLLWKLLRNQSGKARAWSSVSCAMLACVCLLVYAQPTAPLVMNGDPDSARNHDQYYYTLHPAKQREEAPRFRALSYQMELTIRESLRAKVKIRVDIPKLKEYAFTLYHGYQVRSVEDAAGNALVFRQEGDYITVENEPLRAIEGLVFTYAGNSAACYTNSQGVCLPGFFPYYPRPGFYNMAGDEDTGSGFLSVDTTQLTDFDVTVKYHKQVYSNANETAPGRFRARTDCLSLVAGLYRTNTIGTTRFVYPYLYSGEVGTSIQDRVYRQALGMEGRSGRQSPYTWNQKTVLILPRLNHNYSQYFFENHIAASALGLLDRYGQLVGVPFSHDPEKGGEG